MDDDSAHLSRRAGFRFRGAARSALAKPPEARRTLRPTTWTPTKRPAETTVSHLIAGLLYGRLLLGEIREGIAYLVIHPIIHRHMAIPVGP